LYQFRAWNARENGIMIIIVCPTSAGARKRLDMREIAGKLPTAHCCAAILSRIAKKQYLDVF
jgi:hypothetical protein